MNALCWKTFAYLAYFAVKTILNLVVAGNGIPFNPYPADKISVHSKKIWNHADSQCPPHNTSHPRKWQIA